MASTAVAADPTFQTLNLAPEVQAAVDSRGYTVPTPIQAQTIPPMLEGRDVLGQASTGTGKTAAFALPLLSRIDLASRATQVLVLTPTRELAMQVASAFSSYGERLRSLNVQPIYGGASYYNQIRELKHGVHVVVGTPGRVMDHMRRGTLDLSLLKCLVLDEADEMLRMGFVDDVRWVLEQTPSERQCALFSATMPDQIRRIAGEHLRNPAVITIRSETSISATIRPRYLLTPHRDKTTALIRILETEKTDGVIVFVKLKETTLRVADALIEHGFSAVAINGDIVQKQREHTIEQLRNGRLDVLVATDVAARGLDVQRISHVINYDLPHDSEAWIHRIGRTGRAGRQGEAILFLTHQERRHLRSLERDTRQPIAEMQFPTAAAVNARRRADFKQQVTAALASNSLATFRTILTELQQECGAPAEDIAAAVAVMMQGDRPFLVEELRHPEHPGTRPRFAEAAGHRGGQRIVTDRHPKSGSRPAHERGPRERGQRERGQRERQFSTAGPAPEPLTFEHRRPAVRHAPAPAPVAGVAASPAAIPLPPQQPPGQMVAIPKSEFDLQQQSVGRGQTHEPANTGDRPSADRAAADRAAADRIERNRPPAADRPEAGNRPARRSERGAEVGMETYRVEVGHDHGVKAGNIVGAIANESGLDSRNIGRIQIHEDHSLVDLPEGMPQDIYRGLKDVIVLGRHLRISRVEARRSAFRRIAQGVENTPPGRPQRKPSRGQGGKRHSGASSGKARRPRSAQ